MRLRPWANLLRTNGLKVKAEQTQVENQMGLVRFLLYSAGHRALPPREFMGCEAMKNAFRNREKGKDLHVEKPLRCRMCGMRDGLPTLQMAEVLDLTLRGALVEHHGAFQAGSASFLQLGINGELSTIRCRIAHSRARSNGPDGDQYHQTVLEFRTLTPAAEQILKSLIQVLWAHAGWNAGGP